MRYPKRTLRLFEVRTPEFKDKLMRRLVVGSIKPSVNGDAVYLGLLRISDPFAAKILLEEALQCAIDNAIRSRRVPAAV
jgi:hypothetical protein